jgi:hypothetical protein
LHSTSLVDWIMIIGFIAGPGTWIALALRTRRAADQLVLLAVILNMAGTMGVLVAAMIMHLSKPA